MTDYKKQGRLNRAAGATFELRTRADLNFKGWIVDKWSNNVETGNDKKGWLVKELWELIPAKARWAGPGRPMMMGAGFPDFCCRKKRTDMMFGKELSKDLYFLREEKCYEDGSIDGNVFFYEVIGVECKVNGTLSREEKDKCQWLLDNHIFSKILIAYKEKEGRRIVVKYKEFK